MGVRRSIYGQEELKEAAPSCRQCIRNQQTDRQERSHAGSKRTAGQSIAIGTIPLKFVAPRNATMSAESNCLIPAVKKLVTMEATNAQIPTTAPVEETTQSINLVAMTTPATEAEEAVLCKRLPVTELRNDALQSALMLAVLRGRTRLAERLLSLEPSQAHRHYDMGGRNVLHYCAAAEPSVASAVVGQLLRLLRDGRISAVGLRAALTMPDSNWRTPVQAAARRDSLAAVRVLALLSEELRLPREVACAIDAADVVRSGAWGVARWLRRTGQLRVADHRDHDTECDGWKSRLSVEDDAADDSQRGPAEVIGWVDDQAASLTTGDRSLATAVEAFSNALSTRCPADALPAVRLLPLLSVGHVGACRWLLDCGDWRLKADEALREAALFEASSKATRDLSM